MDFFVNKLALIVLLFASHIGVTISAPICDLYVEEFVKEHTGSYDITDRANIKPNSGAFIEIFDSGERMSSEGSTLNRKILYGIIYDEVGFHYRILGEVRKTIVTVSVYSGTNERIGIGTLNLDPGNCGDANHISYSINIKETGDGNLTFPRIYRGGLIKKSDNPLLACKSRSGDQSMVVCRSN